MREGHGGEQCAARATAGAQGVRRMRRAFEGHRKPMWVSGFQAESIVGVRVLEE